MYHDSLTQLLKDADASTPMPAIESDILILVRRRRVRRQMRRGAGAFGVSVLAVALAIIASANRPTRVVTRASQGSLASLSIDADLHQRTAERLLAMQRSRPDCAAESNDGVDSVQLQRDRAALMIVYQANQYLRDDHADLAIAAYRRTIELFPQTHWAEVARQRLRELET